MEEMTLRTGMIARKRFSCTAPVALGVVMFVCSTAAPALAQVGPPQCPREITTTSAMPCPCVARTSVTFKTDVTCVNSDGIIVGANSIIIRLNGFRLQCKDVGYGLSCQGGDARDVGGPKRDTGITIGDFNYVTVRGGGAVQGFDTGVLVSGAASNVVVEKLNITGPDADLGTLPTSGSLESPGSRPNTEGILVRGTNLNSYIDIFANSVDNHTAGIKLENAKGVEVQLNFAHDNNGGIGSMADAFTGEAHGIQLVDSDNNTLHHNLIVDNGVNMPGDSGIMLQGFRSFSNIVYGNNVRFTNGDGVTVRGGAASNVIDSNQILYNTSSETISGSSRFFFDLVSRQAGSNTFYTNNRCETQSSEGTTSIPAGVCKSGEGDPWIWVSR